MFVEFYTIILIVALFYYILLRPALNDEKKKKLIAYEKERRTAEEKERRTAEEKLRRFRLKLKMDVQSQKDRQLKEQITFNSKKVEFIEYIEKNFTINECNKCLEVDYYPLKINRVGTKLKLECNDCGRTIVLSKNEEQNNEEIPPYQIHTRLIELHKIHERYYPNIQDRDNHWFIKLSKKRNDFKDNRKRKKIPQVTKDQVWRRDGGKCVQCGSNENIEFDHLIPHSKGGSNTYRNLQLLCEKCNRSKSNKIG